MQAAAPKPRGASLPPPRLRSGFHAQSPARLPARRPSDTQTLCPRNQHFNPSTLFPLLFASASHPASGELQQSRKDQATYHSCPFPPAAKGPVTHANRASQASSSPVTLPSAGTAPSTDHCGVV
ncbi:unnamed protein product [Parajaminaea phylloscopi]